ncbi:uncharacterized protein N7483_012829 [Penicillium malachiteum]|uniref:uncharacterized protein n=1 Tax=Penicillium malachiteum TaxID=1324776 RepID=UPI0025471351|nr:uncharacterized protein N7483_012829 [Penicillium malachiteum]KAJ5715648.1 hypothetical protein N7483_012829 [Penicillium malachiteum]
MGSLDRFCAMKPSRGPKGDAGGDEPPREPIRSMSVRVSYCVTHKLRCDAHPLWSNATMATTYGFHHNVHPLARLPAHSTFQTL